MKTELRSLPRLNYGWPHKLRREERRGREKREEATKGVRMRVKMMGSKEMKRKSDMGEREIMSKGDGDEENDGEIVKCERVKWSRGVVE